MAKETNEKAAGSKSREPEAKRVRLQEEEVVVYGMGLREWLT